MTCLFCLTAQRRLLLRDLERVRLPRRWRHWNSHPEEWHRLKSELFLPEEGRPLWRRFRVKQSIKIVQQLAKAKLAALILTTTFFGYVIAFPTPLSASSTTLQISHEEDASPEEEALVPSTKAVPAWWCLPGLLTGTALCVTAANTFNQWIEMPLDAQMARTMSRPLVRGAVSPLAAFTFGATASVLGTSLLAVTTNPTTTALGFANILLYAACYTPMKRTNVANTWLGSLVGAIPPIMGWTAATGGEVEPGALLLGGILFAWQFPHFNALSWNLKADYAKAGYRMLSVANPTLCTRVALRYTLALFPITYLFYHFDVTGLDFVATASVLNVALLGGAITFDRQPTAKTSRKLFMRSLVHLPAYLVLLGAHRFWHEYRAEHPDQLRTIQKTLTL